MEETVFDFIGSLFGYGTPQILGNLLLVVLAILVVTKLATSKLNVVPKGMQNIMELYLGGVLSMGKDVVGETYARKYLPLVATIGLMVFFANVIGIIPGFESPTANINFTLPLALAVFFYYNYEGIKKNGVIHYFGHFMGPVPALAPLMFPIEIVSHISRIISLSFRLFGNIKGDDLFLWVLLMLTPWILPLVPFAMLAFMAVLQTFIFMILTYVYLAGAVLIDEEHEEKLPEDMAATATI